ncbi:hypothetical protein ACFX2H_026540 [Malus domestica]
MLLVAASSNASPPVAPARTPTSLTTSPMEASKVKARKSSEQMEKVSKPRAHPFHPSAAHSPQANQHGRTTAHPLPFSDFR